MGVHSLGCAGCGEEIWWIKIVVGVWNLGLGLLCVQSGQSRESHLIVDS
jgi:hypothetical protein